MDSVCVRVCLCMCLSVCVHSGKELTDFANWSINQFLLFLAIIYIVQFNHKQ